jgi:hypothetical protein
MSVTLAFKDFETGEMVCAECWEKEAEGEYKHLTYMVARPKKVKSSVLCSVCKREVGSPHTQPAWDRIEAFLKSELAALMSGPDCLDCVWVSDQGMIEIRCQLTGVHNVYVPGLWCERLDQESVMLAAREECYAED